jgi:hypothetical protein
VADQRAPSSAAGAGQELPDRPDSAAVQVVVTVTTQAVQRTSDLDRRAGKGTAGPDDHDLGAVRVERPAAVVASLSTARASSPRSVG